MAAAEWQNLSHARVAVNISGRQLDQEDFPDRVAHILAETGLPAHRLEVELTESIAASDAALRSLAKLREIGVRAAIDDFGTGYSSLTLLKRLNVDMLKIDQSFVRGAAQTDPDAVILEAIIHMCRGLGLDVMAEGVETLEEMDSLSARGCTLMQGYLFSKPVARQDVETLIGSPDAQWRLPVSRPESWRPPTMEPEPLAVSNDDDLPALRGIPEPSKKA
jgi:EAL domain-containing protein (putative c-di-GMP-specific phosphodiesterase class I)